MSIQIVLIQVRLIICGYDHTGGHLGDVPFSCHTLVVISVSSMETCQTVLGILGQLRLNSVSVVRSCLVNLNWRWSSYLNVRGHVACNSQLTCVESGAVFFPWTPPYSWTSCPTRQFWRVCSIRCDSFFGIKQLRGVRRLDLQHVVLM